MIYHGASTTVGAGHGADPVEPRARDNLFDPILLSHLVPHRSGRVESASTSKRTEKAMASFSDTINVWLDAGGATTSTTPLPPTTRM